MNFGKKVVIVTGAGEGIGRAAAEKYGESGAYVVVADINREAGEETRDFIIKKNGKAVFIKTDLKSRPVFTISIIKLEFFI